MQVWSVSLSPEHRKIFSNNPEQQRILNIFIKSKNKKIVEGTRGPFYTIGSSSLPAADTLTRQQDKTRQDNKTTRQQQFESQSTAPFLHFGVERRPVCLIFEFVSLFLT